MKGKGLALPLPMGPGVSSAPGLPARSDDPMWFFKPCKYKRRLCSSNNMISSA